MIKRILKINIPVVSVTSVLSDFRKNYGNGGLVVAVIWIQVLKNTIQVLFKECDIIQRNKSSNFFILKVSCKKLASNR